MIGAELNLAEEEETEEYEEELENRIIFQQNQLEYWKNKLEDILRDVMQVVESKPNDRRLGTLTGRVRNALLNSSMLREYLEQHELHIVGVPETKGEDLYAMVEGFAKKIGIGCNVDAMKIYREPISDDVKSIVVQCFSQSARRRWVHFTEGKYYSIAEFFPHLSASDGHMVVYENIIMNREQPLNFDQIWSFLSPSYK